ncbi:MAG TPA: nitroreductase family protein [Candidatus Omnitrophota bacterium]|nr:nitroreductase family protein [Candidatus Omnitrophota bacterium]HPS36856.1 nitroreductase family protein [Candidatus Omnitrophota bacterium]
METFDSLFQRASVREYLDKPVPKEMLEKLVDAGRRAPSARAVEPWEFVVVTERATLDKMAGFISTGVFLKQATACIVVFCQETKYYLEDGAAATENILLAATDLGLGTCWIAGDKKEYCDEVLKMFGAPQGQKLISLIAVGWPAKAPRQHKKRKLSEVLHWEKF